MGQPINATYLNQQIARASAVLPGAGAWDAAPTDIQCSDFDFVTLFITYTRGAAGGAVDFRIEVSPDVTGTAWHRLSVQAIGAVVAGADVESDVQAADFGYTATGAAAEYFSYGPLDLMGTAERIRVAAQETGAVGSPGTCEIELRFGVGGTR
jgi:hypothetical protein